MSGFYEDTIARIDRLTAERDAARAEATRLREALAEVHAIASNPKRGMHLDRIYGITRDLTPRHRADLRRVTGTSPAAVVRSAEGRASEHLTPGASDEMKRLAALALRRVTGR